MLTALLHPRAVALSFVFSLSLACGGETQPPAPAAPSPALLAWAGARTEAARPMISDVLERSDASLGTMLELARAGRGPGQLLAPVVKTWLVGDLCADPRYVRCALELGMAAPEGPREEMSGPHHDAAAAVPEGPHRTHRLTTARGAIDVELTPSEGPEGPRVRMRMEWRDGDGVVRLDLVDAGTMEELSAGEG